MKNDTLRYGRDSESNTPLVPVNSNTFQMLNVGSEVLVRFEQNTTKMIVNIPNESPVVFEFHQNIKTQNTLDPIDYVGNYYSPELKTIYSISLENSNLYCEHIRHGKIKLKPLFQDIFTGEWPIRTVEVKRDSKGNIQGLKISNGRTRNVWFKKTVDHLSD